MHRKTVLGGGRYGAGAGAECGRGTAHAQSFVRNKCAKPLNYSFRLRRKPLLGGGRQDAGARADCGRGTLHAQPFVKKL